MTKKKSRPEEQTPKALKVEVPLSFKRRLQDKTPELQRAVLECVDRLSQNSRHQSLRTHRVQGQKGVFEAYVDKANRVTFCYGDDRIVLLRHCNHMILRQS